MKALLDSAVKNHFKAIKKGSADQVRILETRKTELDSIINGAQNVAKV
jgi:hypothetical protein